MGKDKYSKRGNTSKSLVLILALVLVVGCVIGGTLAWLTAKSDPVKNMFTTSDIDITLEETTSDYKMIPGYAIKKDPKVTVIADSEECWLFVELKKSPNFDEYMTYDIGEGWTKGDGTDIPADVVYRKVKKGEIGTAFSVLKDDKVTVEETVTKDMMSDAKNDQPTLEFTAYASQLMKDADSEFSAAEAWKNVQP